MSHHLFWIYPDELDKNLDAATWLETTNELRSLGWTVTLIAAGERRITQIRNTEVVCIPKPNIYLLRQVIFHLQILKLIFSRWGQLDLLLFHQMSLPWILPLKLLRLMGGRRTPLLVMDTRTLPMTVIKAKDRIRSTFDNLMNFMANRWVDGQTAITKRMADSVHIPEKQLWGVWPSGVKREHFALAGRQRNWPTSADEIRLIYVGALFQERRLMALCHAVEKANAAGLAFQFTIIGDGPERMALTEFAAGTAGRIQVLPPVPHKEVPSFLAQAHVGVLPFPDEERFRVSSPIKLFEYMAAGMPIFATKIVCHTDVIGDQPFAFWVEDSTVETLYKGLLACWNARNELSTMGELAQGVVNDWTWAASAKKLDGGLRKGLARFGVAFRGPIAESIQY